MASNGYPHEPPPSYSDHEFDDIDNSVFDNDEEPIQRRYKKKEDKKKNGGRERSSSASSVRVQLNRLSSREVDDSKMQSVFGENEQKAAAAAAAKRNSMKVNPLYDQDGTVELPPDDAERVRSGSTAGEDDEAGSSYKKSSKPFKKSKRRSNYEDEDNNGAQEPKIAYSKNFRFKGPAKQNGALNGQAGNKKVTTAGRIMPSRISRNAIPGSQIMASLSGKERPKPKPAATPQLSNQDELEASQRRSEIRKKWRLVVALILIILVFALILVIVLYFAAKGS